MGQRGGNLSLELAKTQIQTSHEVYDWTVPRARLLIFLKEREQKASHEGCQVFGLQYSPLIFCAVLTPFWPNANVQRNTSSWGGRGGGTEKSQPEAIASSGKKQAWKVLLQSESVRTARDFWPHPHPPLTSDR